MRMSHPSARMALSLLVSMLVLLSALACAVPVNPTQQPTSDGSSSPRGDSPPSSSSGEAFPSTLSGVYHSDEWGTMVLRSVGGDRVRGVYAHDEGTVSGRFIGGRFVGWWCEAPTRSASSRDAGEVNFDFVRDEQGQVLLQGKWTYGVAADPSELRDDWRLRRTPDRQADASLLARFNDGRAFCEGP